MPRYHAIVGLFRAPYSRAQIYKRYLRTELYTNTHISQSLSASSLYNSSRKETPVLYQTKLAKTGEFIARGTPAQLYLASQVLFLYAHRHMRAGETTPTLGVFCSLYCRDTITAWSSAPYETEARCEPSRSRSGSVDPRRLPSRTLAGLATP